MAGHFSGLVPGSIRHIVSYCVQPFGGGIDSIPSDNYAAGQVSVHYVYGCGPKFCVSGTFIDGDCGQANKGNGRGGRIHNCDFPGQRGRVVPRKVGHNVGQVVNPGLLFVHGTSNDDVGRKVAVDGVGRGGAFLDVSVTGFEGYVRFAQKGDGRGGCILHRYLPGHFGCFVPCGVGDIVRDSVNSRQGNGLDLLLDFGDLGKSYGLVVYFQVVQKAMEEVPSPTGVGTDVGLPGGRR